MADSQKQNWEILYGGADIDITRIKQPETSDQKPELVNERVKVRKVPLRKMTELATVWGTVEKELQIYVDKPVEWFDSLTDESALEILKEGRRLNEKTFADWFRLQNQAAAVITGQPINLNEKVNEAIDNRIRLAQQSA